MTDLGAVTLVSKQHDVVGVERYVSLSATLMKHVLRNEYHTRVAMVAAFGKEVDRCLPTTRASSRQQLRVWRIFRWSTRLSGEDPRKI